MRPRGLRGDTRGTGCEVHMPPAEALARPRRLLWPVPVVVFLVIWGLTTHGKFSLTGDEPHYLVMAESLRADGDLDLGNNYDPPASPPAPEPVVIEQHARLDRRGRLRSVHDPGVAMLLLPV